MACPPRTSGAELVLREKEEEVLQLRRVLDRDRRGQADLQARVDAGSKALSAKEEQLDQSRAMLRSKFVDSSCNLCDVQRGSWSSLSGVCWICVDVSWLS